MAAAFIGIVLLGKWLLNPHSSTQLPPSLTKITRQPSLSIPPVEPLKVAATQQNKGFLKKNKSYGHIERQLVVEDTWTVEPADSSSLVEVAVQTDAITSSQSLSLLEKGEAFSRAQKEEGEAHKSPLVQKGEGESGDEIKPKERCAHCRY